MAGMNMGGHGAHAARPAATTTGPRLRPATSGIVMAMNGQPFDMKRIDAQVDQGSHEIWEIVSGEMPHPFHVHGASFRVLSKDGAAPGAHEAGWKDTVLVEKKAELLVRFDQPAAREQPFMFHCHILEHEDLGMMGQYVTV